MSTALARFSLAGRKDDLFGGSDECVEQALSRTVSLQAGFSPTSTITRHLEHNRAKKQSKQELLKQQREEVAESSLQIEARDEPQMIRMNSEAGFSVSSEKLATLQESLGDFGVALFCPLLTLEEGVEGASPLNLTEEVHDVPPEDETPAPSKTILLAKERTYPMEDELEDHSQFSDDDDYSPLIVREELQADLMACPRILTESMMQEIKDYGLPTSLQQHHWERCFCIGLHGDSFVSLLSQTRRFKYTLLVIRTVRGDIFGGFASETWKGQDGFGSSNAYYGNGQSFLFSVNKNKDPNDILECNKQIDLYKWTGNNDYCQICDDQKRTLCMGGVGDFGFVLQDNISIGITGKSETYGNPPLVDSLGGAFEVADFEIYGLVSLFSQSRDVMSFSSPTFNSRSSASRLLGGEENYQSRHSCCE